MIACCEPLTFFPRSSYAREISFFVLIHGSLDDNELQYYVDELVGYSVSTPGKARCTNSVEVYPRQGVAKLDGLEVPMCLAL